MRSAPLTLILIVESPTAIAAARAILSLARQKRAEDEPVAVALLAIAEQLAEQAD